MKGRTASAVRAARRPLAHRTGNARRRCAGSPSTPSGAKGAAPAARARRAPPYLSTRERDAAGAASAAGSATATSASAAREATRRVCGREAACAGAAAAERGRASWRAIAAGCRERATCIGHTLGYVDSQADCVCVVVLGSSPQRAGSELAGSLGPTLGLVVSSVGATLTRVTNAIMLQGMPPKP